MKPTKRTTFVLVVATAVSGWFVGRGTESDVRAEAVQSDLDPHVVVSAPSLIEARRLAVSAKPADAVVELRNPLQAAAEEEFHKRDLNEWQGMLVDMTTRQICDQTTSCGLALSCGDDGKCGPCEVDNDCAGGESCVLDHCLPASQVECTSRNDCAHLAADAYCVLSGLTGGEHRGNSQMRAYCQASTGGTQAEATAPDPRRQRHGEHVRPAFSRQDLVKELADGLR